MLLYVDHGACRDIYTSVDRYLSLLRDKPWAILSTLPYIIESNEEREKLVDKILEIWLKITGSLRLVEDVYVLSRWFRVGMLSRSDLARKLVRLLSEVDHYLEDLSLMNMFLKISTGLALPDIGLIVIYENPLLVEQGVRQRPLPVSRPVLRRAARAIYESRISKGLRELELEYTVVRNVGLDRPAIVDWSSLGMYPFSSQRQSIVNDQEVADPLLVVSQVYNIRIRTTLEIRPSIIQHYRDVRDVSSSLMYYARRARELLRNQIIVLPNTMTNIHVSTVTGFLRALGVNVLEIINVPVDLLLASLSEA